MGSRQRFELGHHTGVVTEVQLRGDLLLDRLEPEFLEPRDLSGQRRLAREIRERWAPPERQGLAEDPIGRSGFVAVRTRLVEQVFEPLGVHLVAIRPEEVAGGVRLDAIEVQ